MHEYMHAYIYSYIHTYMYTTYYKLQINKRKIFNYINIPIQIFIFYIHVYTYTYTVIIERAECEIQGYGLAHIEFARGCTSVGDAYINIYSYT